MDCTLALFLSSVLALLTMGAGASLSPAIVRNKVKLEAEHMVDMIETLNNKWMSSQLVGGSLDPSTEKHLEGLSSIVEVIETYHVLLESLPQERLRQLKVSVNSLKTWLEKMCPGTQQTAWEENQLELPNKFPESKSLVVLGKLKSFLYLLKSNLNVLQTCSTTELKDLEKKSAS
ncbi:leptin a [Osmerus mordax]|uniref:leptin a n=1 Tax=Osmerus mordax TaxID=8014 RepID=UPI00350F869A